MTQKKIGDDLYVFKQEAYEITQDTDAEKIFIQLELIDAFKALNEELASKIVPINYNLFQVTKPIYADYINADDPEPEVEGAQGTQGAQGEQGAQGTQTPSTAEVETEGAQGEQGAQGTQGAQSDPDPEGAQGTQGE